jgi:hypothetical protein
MVVLYLTLFFTSTICLIVGLIDPTIFNRIIKPTRKSIGLIFGVAIITFFLSTWTAYKEKGYREISLSLSSQLGKTMELMEEMIGETTPEPEPETTPEPEQTGADLLPEKAEVGAIIETNARNEWGNDYRMVRWQIDQQTEAYNWLIKQKDYLSILKEAINEWGDDYGMVKWEYESQVEAYKNL